MTKTTKIKIVGPEYYGAPYPEFTAEAINESQFEHDCRYKEADVRIEWPDDGSPIAKIEWVSQKAAYPSDKFEAEVLRALNANGFPERCDVIIKFRSRDDNDFIVRKLKS